MMNPIMRMGLSFVYAALAAAFIPLAAHAETGAENALYERAAVLAADARCGLFDTNTRAALEAARAQSRSAMIRAGAPANAVASAERYAADAAQGWKCNSPDMKIVADRVRSSFGAYKKIGEMHYPGDQRTWVAQTYTAERTAKWRVSQAASGAGIRYQFGIAERNGQTSLMLVVAGPVDARPSAAVVSMRDFKRAPRPVGAGFLSSVTFQSTKRSTPLNARVAPQAVSFPYFAASRSIADPSLSPDGSKTAIAFQFPLSAITHLEQLDPREAIEVRLTIPATAERPEQTSRVYFEVGDFAAARAFIRAAS